MFLFYLSSFLLPSFLSLLLSLSSLSLSLLSLSLSPLKGPRLSDEQLASLRALAMSEGHGKQGRSRSVLDNALALRHVDSHQQAGSSLNSAVSTVAAADLVSPNTIRSVYSSFISTNTLLPPSTEHRGRGNPLHPLNPQNTDSFGPSLQAELLIHNLVERQKSEGISLNFTIISAELREQYKLKYIRLLCSAGFTLSAINGGTSVS